MALSLNLGRVRQRENAKGGGYLYLRQISPTPSDTFLDVGWLGGTDFDDKKTTIESKIDQVGLCAQAYNTSSPAATSCVHLKLS